MNHLYLQPETALGGITGAQGAGTSAASATPAAAGPVATGAMSLIDAAVALLGAPASGSEGTRSAAMLLRTETLAGAATTSVAEQVATDESNANRLDAVGGGA